MKISDILKPESVISKFSSLEKTDVINELVDLLKNDPRVNDIEEVRKAVLDREKIMSTGVGSGFAIPHGKTQGVNEIVAAFGKSDEDIEFKALDGQPVNLVFLLVGKVNNVGPHIKLLSRISRMMNKDEFRNKLIECNDTKEIYNLFIEEEKNYVDLK